MFIGFDEIKRVDDEHVYTLNLKVDKRGRVWIPMTASREAKLTCGKHVWISHFNWCKAISLVGYKHYGFDKKIKSGMADKGFYVSIKKYFDGYHILNAIIDPKNETIFITA